MVRPIKFKQGYPDNCHRSHGKRSQREAAEEEHGRVRRGPKIELDELAATYEFFSERTQIVCRFSGFSACKLAANL